MIITKQAEPINLTFKDGTQEKGAEFKIVVDNFFLQRLSDDLGKQVTEENLHHAFQVWLDQNIRIASCNKENIEDY